MATSLNSLDLQNWPTIRSNNFCNLKIETPRTKVWVSRMGIRDGETEPLQIEELHDGVWTAVCPHSYTLAVEGVWYHLSGPSRMAVGGDVAPCFSQRPYHEHRKARFSGIESE